MKSSNKNANPVVLPTHVSGVQPKMKARHLRRALKLLASVVMFGGVAYTITAIGSLWACPAFGMSLETCHRLDNQALEALQQMAKSQPWTVIASPIPAAGWTVVKLFRRG